MSIWKQNKTKKRHKYSNKYYWLIVAVIWKNNTKVAFLPVKREREKKRRKKLTKTWHMKRKRKDRDTLSLSLSIISLSSSDSSDSSLSFFTELLVLLPLLKLGICFVHTLLIFKVFFFFAFVFPNQFVALVRLFSLFLEHFLLTVIRKKDVSVALDFCDDARIWYSYLSSILFRLFIFWS